MSFYQNDFFTNWLFSTNSTSMNAEDKSFNISEKHFEAFSGNGLIISQKPFSVQRLHLLLLPILYDISYTFQLICLFISEIWFIIGTFWMLHFNIDLVALFKIVLYCWPTSTSSWFFSTSWQALRCSSIVFFKLEFNINLDSSSPSNTSCYATEAAHKSSDNPRI